MSSITPSERHDAQILTTTPLLTGESKTASGVSDTKNQVPEKIKNSFLSSLSNHVIKPFAAIVNSPLRFLAETVRALLVINVILPSLKNKVADLTTKREGFLERRKEEITSEVRDRISTKFYNEKLAALQNNSTQKKDPKADESPKAERDRQRDLQEKARSLTREFMKKPSTESIIQEQAEIEFNARFKHEQIAGNGHPAKGLPKQPNLDGFSVSHPNQPADPSKQKWIIFLNGNAGTYEDSLADLETLSNKTGCNVLSANYRGVGNSSPDSPPRSSEDLNDDARNILAHLRSQGVPTENILIHGYSTGGGPAAVLCQENPQLHLCAERTFSRYADVAGTLAGRVGRKVVEAAGWRFNSVAALSQTPKLKPGEKIGHRFAMDSEADGLIRPKARLGAQMAAKLGPRLILAAPQPPQITVITLKAKADYRPQKFFAKHLMDLHGHTAHWYGDSSHLHVKEGARERLPLDVYAEQVQQAFADAIPALEAKPA